MIEPSRQNSTLWYPCACQPYASPGPLPHGRGDEQPPSRNAASASIPAGDGAGGAGGHHLSGVAAALERRDAARANGAQCARAQGASVAWRAWSAPRRVASTRPASTHGCGCGLSWAK